MESAQFSTGRRPLVIGHRGASGHAPENSIAAFVLAATPGHPARCDGVELDVQTTSDGQFVVHHDPALATGDLISALPLSRVRASQLTDGTPVPTLAEAIRALRGLELFVEAKTLPPSADAALLATLATHEDARFHVHGFDHRIIARLRRLDPAVSLGVLSCSYPVDPTAQVTRAGAGTLWQQGSLIDAALVSACRRDGISLIAWTVNDRAEARTLAALGVDGLCGNWPERLH